MMSTTSRDRTINTAENPISSSPLLLSSLINQKNSMEVVTVGKALVDLISLLRTQFSQLRNVKKDVETLISTLSSIRPVLGFVREMHVEDKRLADWLRALKQATFDANVALDPANLVSQSSTNRVSLSSSSTSNPFKPQFITSLSEVNILLRRKIVQKIKDTKIIFEAIAMEMEKPFFHSESQVRNIETTLTISAPHIYGRGENKMKIIDILVNFFNNQESVCIYPICGIAGIGKTSLAQSIFIDDTVQRHFDVKIWVSVSDPFDIKRILKSIIESFYPKTCDLETWESIQRKVAETLKKKKYLIVLDDMRPKYQDEWKKLKSFLGVGAKGSSVLLTTRSLTAASVTGTIPSYPLGALSHDDCFSLLMYHALGYRSGEELGYRREEEFPNLFAIGNDIAMKCNGVPLAAKYLGNLLRLTTDEMQWKLVRDSEIWTLTSGENSVLGALLLSYNHFHLRVQRCFSHCFIFQKNLQMQKSKLVYLWIANGFIQAQGNMELEDIGDGIFNELLQKSFFQDATQDNYENIESCKMHNIMHNLASSVVTDEYLIANVGQIEPVPQRIKHLSVVCDSPQSSTDVDYLFSSQPALHTLFFFNPIDISRFQFSYTLRVLNLSEMGIEIVPNSVCDLELLRYLDLSDNLLRSLPESIHKLRKLQMLDVGKNSDITTLPFSICELKNLRYLGISECYMLNKMPVGVGRLRNLTTLAEFVVGTSSDGNSEGGLDISELKDLNKLRGGLKIKGLENVRNGEHAKEADLMSKINVTRLQLIWESDDSLQVDNSKEVLEQLGLPPNIQDLEITNYKWESSFPEKFLRNLNRLRSVEINSSRKLKSLPRELENLKAFTSLTISGCHELVSLPEGLLQKLVSMERLKIWSCNKLKSLGATRIQGGLNPNIPSSSSSSSHLHLSLQKLEICDCPELVFSEDDFQHFNALRYLCLEGLPKLTALPQGIQQLRMLQNIKIFRCMDMRILPEWVEHLTALRSLEIIYCHEELRERCDRENGEYWCLISHISEVIIR